MTNQPGLRSELVYFLATAFPDLNDERERKNLISEAGCLSLGTRIIWAGSVEAFFSGLLDLLAMEGQDQMADFLEGINKCSKLGVEDSQRLNNICTIVKRLSTDRWQLEFPPVSVLSQEEAQQVRDARDLANGVEEIIKRLKAQVEKGSGNAGSTFKGLFSYRLEDADIFAGREAAIQGLRGCMNEGALTVLHSESGAGKTSLLQAGIQASLIRSGHLAIWLLPAEQNPSDKGREEAGYKIRTAFVGKLSDTLRSTPLNKFLRQVCDLLGAECKLYLLLDQFEEFFAWWEESAREPFLLELADCLRDQSLNVHWVLAMRGEDLSHITGELERKYHIYEAFRNQYWLPRLTRAEAKTVLEGIENRRDRKFEPELVEAILDDLGKDGGVAPTQLQVILLAWMPDTAPIETSLDAYNAAGGTKAILHNFLDDQIKTIDAKYRVAARHLLKALVTSTKQRSVRLEADLKAELEPQGFAADQINGALRALIDRHLIVEKEREEDGRLTYELVHDYLIEKIELNPQVLARKAAEELLAQGLEQYKRGVVAGQHSVLLGEEALSIINAHRRWLNVTDEEEDLMRRSQAVANYRRWLPELGQLGGLLGFGLAYVLTYACQTVTFSIFFFGLLIRALPGAIAGLAFVLGIDAAIVKLRGSGNWRRWLTGGLIGAACFGAMLILHKLFETPGGPKPLIFAGIEGAVWGAIAGLGAVWALTSRRPVWLTLPSVGLACGATLLLVDMAGAAFQGPNFSKSGCFPWFGIRVFLAGGLAPLLMILPARLGRGLTSRMAPELS
jgi:hypothetical protein